MRLSLYTVFHFEFLFMKSSPIRSQNAGGHSCDFSPHQLTVMLCSLIVASLFLGSARGLLQLRIKQQVLVQGPKSPRSIHEFINDLHEYLDLTFYGYVRSNVVVEPHVDSYAISGYILFREDAALGPLGLKNAETSRFEDICSELNKSLLLHKDTSKESRRIRGRQLRVSSIARPSDGTPGQKHRGLVRESSLCAAFSFMQKQQLTFLTSF